MRKESTINASRAVPQNLETIVAGKIAAVKTKSIIRMGELRLARTICLQASLKNSKRTLSKL